MANDRLCILAFWDGLRGDNESTEEIALLHVRDADVPMESCGCCWIRLFRCSTGLLSIDSVSTWDFESVGLQHIVQSTVLTLPLLVGAMGTAYFWTRPHRF